MAETNPNVGAYLRSFGLEPRDIVQEDLNEDGYYKVVRDSRGIAMVEFDSDELMTRWRLWPRDFDFERFKVLAAEDGLDLG